MNIGQLLTIIERPHTSEKTENLADRHKQFTLRVKPSATKFEIKKAVEYFFKVNVLSVNVIQVKGKEKTFRQRVGKRKNWKKAIIKIPKDQELNFLTAE